MPILGHIKTAAIHSFFLDSSPRFDHHNLQYIQVPYQYDIKLFLAFSCCFLYIHEFYLYDVGSSRYHGEDNLGLLVDHLISDHLVSLLPREHRVICLRFIPTRTVTLIGART